MSGERTRKPARAAAAALDPRRLCFRWADRARFADVEALFGERGACAGCWCMFWRLPRPDFTSGKGAGNRRALRALVAEGARPGVLAYLDGVPIAWCALAPREDYPALARSRVLAPVDATKVWSVSCFFVARPYRRQGVATLLLEAAVALARKRGARVIEGYPVEPWTASAPAAFVWTGTPQVFASAGFREVARRSRGRPVMRLAVG